MNNQISNQNLVGRVQIPAIVTQQGSRITYQANLMYRQITNLFDHTEEKPKNENKDIIDIRTLRNRYLRSDKVDEIVEYVENNLDSYILPPISAISHTPFAFQPYNHEEIVNEMGEQYDLMKRPELIGEVIEHFDGMLQGLIIFRESDFNVEILDGNHRVAAIHKLVTKGRDFKALRIGVQIFIENDLERIRQAFVDMNTSTPIDKTIITLFSSRDALSLAAKELINPKSPYVLEEFSKESPDYIGFDAINDNITRKSNAVLSLNMVKNMLVKFALGASGTPKKFNSVYSVKSTEYYQLVSDFSTYLKNIITTMEPFDEIKSMGPASVPELREQYISLTGAGLYLIANIGYHARKENEDMQTFPIKLSELNWKRIINNEANPLFRSGILSETGKISNNRSSILSTLDSVGSKVGLTLK